MKAILKSLVVIGLVAGLTVGATRAFFSDVETSAGNTFTAGTLDLVVDIDGVVYNPLDRPIFSVTDMKPGDSGEETISLHVDNDACGFVTFDLTSDKDNSCTEPEIGDESGCVAQGTDEGTGELDDNVNWVIWKDEGSVGGWQCGNNNPGCENDPKEGDNVMDGPFDVPLLSGTLTADKAYGFGDLLLSHGYYYGFKWELPGTVGNEVQSDSFTADMVIKAEQKRNQHASCPFGEQTP